MACWLTLAPQQTKQQRDAEVKKALTAIDKMLAAKRAQVVVGKQGAVTFTGISQADKRGLSDACVYRLLTQKGSAQAKMAIKKAEMLAGRGVSEDALKQGLHSHDGGKTWSAH